MVSSSFRAKGWKTGLIAFGVALAAHASASPEATDRVAVPQLAIVVTDDAVPLEEIVSGRARLGFSPLVGHGLSLVGSPGKTVWLRLRAELAQDNRARFVSLPRQAIDRVRLFSVGDATQPLGSSGLAEEGGSERWPDAFVLPMPVSDGPTATVYLEVHGRGALDLQPSILTGEQARERAASASSAYGLLYGGLVLIGLLAIFRRFTSGVHGLRVAQASFVCLAASLVDNHHLAARFGAARLDSWPAVPIALWVLACAAMLRATQRYAGHEKNAPDVAQALDRLSFVFLAIALGLLFVPAHYLPQMQVAGLCLLAATALICGSSLFLDPRHWRWTPMLVWLGVFLSLAAIPLSMLQLVPQSMMVRRGFQMLLALQLVGYLVLPWIRRSLQERQKLKRQVVVEPTAEEKIAHAREMVISSLQAGIESAAESDMEWIAYRRLMAGLKPVLPQTAAAVVAMNYHNEDLLLVEPKEAEPRFRMLLTQRASMLKSLSRSLAPQQIVIDFDGPEGPLQHVMLAIIPLPIDRPGWGALVIEREADAEYSDAELDLCAEFAALATTAADEASAVMQLRQANEIDEESGAFKPAIIEQRLARANDLSLQKRQALSLLRIAVDGYGDLPTGASAGFVRCVADAIREEIDYGETLGRSADDEFLLLLPGRAIGDARSLGERICAQVRKRAMPVSAGATLAVSIGASQLLPGERTAQLLLERSQKALVKARQYGGNQVQAIASSTV